MAIDATIIHWLFLTIAPDIFKTVVHDGDDARTVWTEINGLFTDNKLQRVVFLQQEFFGTLQGDLSLDDYCLRLKDISDELQDLGFMMGDELLLSTLTAGLSEDLGNAASNLTLMTNPTFERAVSYLWLEERRLLKLRACVSHTALAAVLGYGAPAPPAPPAPTPPVARPTAPFATCPPVPFAAPLPPPQQQQQGRHRHGRGGGGRNNGGYAGGGPPPANQMLPWSGGYNPWTGVVHAYTMPVPCPPIPGILGTHPRAHQAFYAAPQQPNAPTYGGMPSYAPSQ
jgi:hypothetical protein